MIPLATISAVKWPVRPEHLDKRTRLCCFSVEADGKEYVFAAKDKAWYAHSQFAGNLRPVWPEFHADKCARFEQVAAHGYKYRGSSGLE